VTAVASIYRNDISLRDIGQPQLKKASLAAK
jgi:hypothetical protein